MGMSILKGIFSILCCVFSYTLYVYIKTSNKIFKFNYLTFRCYQVVLNVGQPPRPYFLDVDTGSDLTWLQCDIPGAKNLPVTTSLFPVKPNIINMNLNR